jgi:putative restriction endonuclease
MKIEVSKKIKEKYQNGKEYYQYHGQTLKNIPTRASDKPQDAFVEWHNTKIYKG